MESPTYVIERDGSETRVRIRAGDLGEACTSLAFALCDLFAEAGGVRTSGASAVIVRLDLHAQSGEGLVLRLARLVLDHLAKGQLVPVLWAPDIDETHLHGELLGEQFEPGRHRLRLAPPRTVSRARLTAGPGQVELVVQLS